MSPANVLITEQMKTSGDIRLDDVYNWFQCLKWGSMQIKKVTWDAVNKTKNELL